MNLKQLLFIGASSVSLVTSRLAFYSQQESLSIVDDPTIPDIHLGVYHEKRPLVFGLVANKSRAHNSDGYLCYAENHDTFVN
jgi:hypothetical protein